MRRIYMLFLALAVVMGVSMQADAALELIGTASYDSDGDGIPESYNLIYDNDGPFGPIVWLDYSRDSEAWQNQMDWATGLNTIGVLTYDLNPGLKISWTGNWHLPLSVEGPYTLGVDGTTTAGWNVTSSEMGHLFYTELGNQGQFDIYFNVIDCVYNPSPWCLTNTGDFQNLIPEFYWSGTHLLGYTGTSWAFLFDTGLQLNWDEFQPCGFGIAVRPAAVTQLTPEEQIEEIQDFFDDSVLSGDLTGNGRTPSSSDGKLKALMNMLAEAESLIQSGEIAGACLILSDAYKKIDGNPNPPDFVTGTAAAELAAMIQELMTALGCN